MSRRLAREVALRTLFQMDIGHITKEDAFNFALETTPLSEELIPFAEDLVNLAIEHQAESDAIIKAKSVDWSLERLPRVDRSILRLAIGEMLAEIGTPTGVIINEAVELAHRYGTEESGRFINGLLGNLARDG
ncbi:MAG: transcription antitermination factor NusB [Firmicutes bacterium]|jgi:N utilization substance protein B|nr:transcription antitermination factor NusB [Bacillota bacterium]